MQLGPVCQHNDRGEQMLCLAEDGRKPITTNGHSALIGPFFFLMSCEGLAEESPQVRRLRPVKDHLPPILELLVVGQPGHLDGCEDGEGVVRLTFATSQLTLSWQGCCSLLQPSGWGG